MFNIFNGGQFIVKLLPASLIFVIFSLACQFPNNLHSYNSDFDPEMEFRKNIECGSYSQALLNYIAIRNLYGPTKNDYYNMSFLARMANDRSFYSHCIDRMQHEEKSMFNDYFLELLDVKTKRAFEVYSGSQFVKEDEVSQLIRTNNDWLKCIYSADKSVACRSNDYVPDYVHKRLASYMMGGQTRLLEMNEKGQRTNKIPDELNLFVIDNLMVLKYNYQIFGTARKSSFINNEYKLDHVLYPITRTKFCDSLRRKMGLKRINSD